MTTNVILSAVNLRKQFGSGLMVTRDVCLELSKGARHALIGPNGAGKTTLVNLLTGVLRPTAGQVLLEGENITDLSADKRVKRGLVRTFQINQLFETQTPLHSLLMVATQSKGGGNGFWKSLGSNREIVEHCEYLLERLNLTDVMYQPTHQLAYGKRRQLEIGIALACEPVVLLLDEPGAGVPIQERDEILRIVSELPTDVAVLLIEHDMEMVFAFADTITVMVEGAVLCQGSPDDIATDSRVRAVYLGQTHAANGQHGQMVERL